MGGSGTDYNAANYAQGRSAYEQGADLSGADPNHPEYQALVTGYNDAKAEAEKESQYEEMMSGMMEGFSFEMPEMTPYEPDPMDYIGNQSASFAKLQEYLPYDAMDPDLLTEYEGKQYYWEGGAPEEGGGWAEYVGEPGYGWKDGMWEVASPDKSGYTLLYDDSGNMYNRSEFDDIMGARMDAAGSAVDFVNSQIQKEQSNANLLGIDYSITDDMKQTRINNQFATMWGESDEAKLMDLAGVWGISPDLSGVKRGDASALEPTESSQTVTSRSKGLKPKPTLAESPDTTLASTTLLGA